MNLLRAAEAKWTVFMSEERGDSNIIAIIMIITVVIAAVAVFKEGLLEILNTMLDKIKVLIEQ